MSIRSKPIQAIPFKKDYHPHPSKGHYNEDEKLARRAALGVERGERWFDYAGELYVRSGLRSDGPFVAWTAGAWWKL